MENKSKNIAYVDGANLHKGILDLGWQLDYAKFRIWLKEKYGVQRAFLFIGLLPGKKELYEYLQKAGYILVFKEIAYDGNGKVKGNCDADLVLHAVVDCYEHEYQQAILVTSDGDFSSLTKWLLGRKKLSVVLAPSHKKCSILLKKTGAKLTYLEELRPQLAQNKRAPDTDGTV